MAEWTKHLKGKKKKALRHNEYYDMQTLFDELYGLSLKAKEYAMAIPAKITFLQA